MNDMTRPAYLRDILIEEIKQNPHITNRELAKILNVGTVYVSLLTKKLTDEGLITFSLNDNHVKEFEIRQTENVGIYKKHRRHNKTVTTLFAGGYYEPQQ